LICIKHILLDFCSKNIVVVDEVKLVMLQG